MKQFMIIAKGIEERITPRRVRIRGCLLATRGSEERGSGLQKEQRFALNLVGQR